MLGIAVIQQREQAKARIRQQVAKYRYRANETASILDNFSAIPIGENARKLLLQYIQLNLLAAKKIAPNDPTLSTSLTNISLQLKNTKSKIDQQRLNIPTDVQQLNILIKNLSKLGNYIMQFKNVAAMNRPIITPAVQRIMLLISEAKICAYIQQAKSSLTEHNYVQAQRDFQIAQQMLDRFPNKNSRLESLDSELKELVNSTPSEAAKTSLSIDAEGEENSPHKSEEDSDQIFGPKKKW